MHSSDSNRRTASQRNKRARPFAKLTIDTKCGTQGRTFPYESRLQELTFVSFDESRARKKATAASGKLVGLRQHLENHLPLRRGAERNLPHVTDHRNITPAPHTQRNAQIPAISRQESLTVPLCKRVRGLRPAPLDLNQDVSPSDQAIPIGIALSPSTLSTYTKTPNSPILRRTPDTPRVPLILSEDRSYGREASTPRIVVTPAKEQFSPIDVSGLQHDRRASSVYSRYTNSMSNSRVRSDAPPVPPLPSFLGAKAQKSWFSDYSRDSVTTSFEEDASPEQSRNVITTTHSDDTHACTAPRQSTLTASLLPTPRRSRGWWNVITSPFSAKSATTPFWRSASPSDRNVEAMSILADAADMAMVHDGVIFTNRAPDDDDLRSAPAVTGSNEEAPYDAKPLPRRADTAPAALDIDDTTINIYRIPSTGEAALYYNPSRHFPSICRPDSGSRGMLNDGDSGWSPSQSVFRPSPRIQQDDDDDRSANGISELPESPRANDDDIAASKHMDKDECTALVNPSPKNHGPIFSTPSEDELKSAGLSRAPPNRTLTEATMTSQSSPLSATPVVRDARLARLVRPQSNHAEQIQAPTEQAPTPSHYGLGFATMGAATIINDHTVEAEKTSLRPAHIGQDSHGLGISDAESELWPPVKPLSEKPRLGTDRFGQLTVRRPESNRPAQPWYRRFFWPLAAATAALLLILIVLMVVLIPQRHNDMRVQGTWLNLTAFPPMFVGVSTVISPNRTKSSNTCVSPPDMWSCVAPKVVGTDLPNFRFEIRFRNGTVPGNETEIASTTKRWQEKRLFHRFVKRSSWSRLLYSSSPTPPSAGDRAFLGRTTDNVSTPYAGEETPFYISLLDPVTLPSSSKAALRKRGANFEYPYPDTSDSNTQKKTSTNATTQIPPAAHTSSGEPVAQDLYPFVTSQPLRLFDRGKPTEHFSFYTYFDRSIYVAGLSATTNNSSNSSSSSSNTNFTSNIPLDKASAVCTFSQTRVLVQIWTAKNKTMTSSSSSSSSPQPSTNSTSSSSTATTTSPPGSFPYPITITLDRHGGQADKKGVYCYGLANEENAHRIVNDAKIWISEDRAVGGTLVNPADIPGVPQAANSGTVSKRSEDDDGEEEEEDGDGTGIDGGTGGCGCVWQNWW